MNVLIKIQSQIINGSAVETVSARELHSFLEVATRFDDWISTRIKEYDFINNQDFVCFTENSVKPNDGRPSQEYYITLYMAKGLSMVEHNEKGKQARKYFSEVSKLFPRGLRTYAEAPRTSTSRRWLRKNGLSAIARLTASTSHTTLP